MDAEAALQHWELGAVSAIDALQTGAVNRVFRVTTARGQVYLRVYRTQDRDVVAREHALIVQVLAAGLPAVAPIASTSGDTVIVVDSTPCALYEAAAGFQLEKHALALEHALAAGEMLGRLHGVLARVADAGYRRYRLRWPAEAWRERLAGIARAISARGDDSADAHVLQRIRDQRAWLAEPRCSHAYEPVFTPQVIHGDYQHANLFFAPGAVSAVSAILDWEQAAYMPRAFEAVRAAAYMFDLEPQHTRAFLHAYRDVTHIGDDELDDGARAWGCMSDHYVWALEEVYLHGNERARRYIPRDFRPFEQAWAAVESAG